MTHPALDLTWCVQQQLNGTSALVNIRHHHVIVTLPDGLSTPEKGERLLNLEKVLRSEVRPDLEVFLTPMQDRNAVRRFRGVVVNG